MVLRSQEYNKDGHYKNKNLFKLREKVCSKKWMMEMTINQIINGKSRIHQDKNLDREIGNQVRRKKMNLVTSTG